MNDKWDMRDWPWKMHLWGLKQRSVAIEQEPELRPKRPSDENQFTVSYATKLRLNLGDCVFRGVPPESATTSCQAPLRELSSKAKCPHLWTNNVLFQPHLPNSEVDRRRKKHLTSSDLGRSTVRG